MKRSNGLPPSDDGHTRTVRLGAGVLFVLALAGCGHGEVEPEVIRPAMVEQPFPGTAAISAFPGDVRAREEAALSFRVAGKIAKRLVDAGDTVKQGDVLAELDPEDLRLQLQASSAQAASADANLALARAERDRYKALLDRKLVSQSAFDAQNNAYEAAAAQARQAYAQRDVTRNQAGYAKLVAPSDGVIATRQAEAGQNVAAGQTVFTLAADGEREVAISLPEQRIGEFSVGQQVLVELWSRSGERVPGTIRELSRSADPLARTYAARVAFDAEVGHAQLGQSARVYVGSDAGTALSVPLTAVTAEADTAYVWVVDPATSQLRRAPVQTGAYGEERVPVLSGIAASDWIVVAGTHLVREGQTVHPVDRDNRAVALAATP